MFQKAENPKQELERFHPCTKRLAKTFRNRPCCTAPLCRTCVPPPVLALSLPTLPLLPSSLLKTNRATKTSSCPLCLYLQAHQTRPCPSPDRAHTLRPGAAATAHC